MIYGYRLENGRAVADESEIQRIHIFIKKYLSGSSIPVSGRCAGIEKSKSALRRILSNPVYLGTDFYPQVLTKRTYNRVQRELMKRTHPATAHPASPVPVYTQFSPLPDINVEGLLSSDAAEVIYHAIKPTSLSQTPSADVSSKTAGGVPCR